jgi:hypothetical protein
VPLVENNYVIKTISAYGSDNSFNEGILPWRPGRCDNLLDTKALDPSSESLTINGIPITQQIARSGIERKCFHQLPCCPLGSGVLCHVEVHNLPAVMAEHDEYIKHSKSGGRDSEEIYRCQTLCMITEKSSPSL